MKKEDFFKLCEELAKLQYEDIENEDEHWIPGESEYARTKKKSQNVQIKDLTDTPKDDIKAIILENKNIQIGNFLIKLSDYIYNEQEIMFISLTIYEYKKHNGVLNKIAQKVNPRKDTRFKSFPWVKNFNFLDCGEKIPVDEIANILKYFQLINKGVFLI